MKVLPVARCCALTRIRKNAGFLFFGVNGFSLILPTSHVYPNGLACINQTALFKIENNY